MDMLQNVRKFAGEESFILFFKIRVWKVSPQRRIHEFGIYMYIKWKWKTMDLTKPYNIYI